MKNLYQYLLLTICTGILFISCTELPTMDISYDPETLEFSGTKALATVKSFVKKFPNRHSGTDSNSQAAQWLFRQFDSLGLSPTMTEWDIINYSLPLTLKNVSARIPGRSAREILIVAHFDQSPATIEGADNDASGIAVLFELARIFSKHDENSLPYTLVFLAADGEEYGMLGTRYYVDNHPQIKNIIAGVSIDNVGKSFYNGLHMDARGQFRNYGALWLQIMARESVKKAGNVWVPEITPPVLQILDQAVPVSFMDEGPMVAAGIPAFGFAGAVPQEYAELHWQTYHSPGDLAELQSAVSLFNTGRAVEALVQELLTKENFPEEAGPYIYFSNGNKVLRGFPLWTIFILIIIPFAWKATAIIIQTKTTLSQFTLSGLRFLSIWLPLVIGILGLYAFVSLGLMDKYELYPATSKDPALFHPHWGAVILWLFLLTILFYLGRRFLLKIPAVDFVAARLLAMVMVVLFGIYLLVINPFSLLFIIPLLFWLLVDPDKSKPGNILLFLLSTILLFILLYFFGFVILRNNFAILWYIMMMFSIKMVSFSTAIMIAGLMAAGWSLMEVSFQRNYGTNHRRTYS
jgi:Peptidase family M28